MRLVTEPREPRKQAGDELLDDPLKQLEVFVAYLRERASRVELAMAGRWAGVLVGAIGQGAQRFGEVLPTPLTYLAEGLARWADDIEERPQGGQLWVPGRAPGRHDGAARAASPLPPVAASAGSPPPGARPLPWPGRW
jgi:hypothetical protein